MKIKFCSTLLFILLNLIFLSQNVPKLVNYQAIAYDINGNPLNQQNIVVKIGILKGLSSSVLLYEEEHSITTANNGLFSLKIGNGTSTGNGTSNMFGNVVWDDDDFYLNVQLNVGNGFENLGTQQLVSVPFAFRAKKAEFVTNPGTFINAGNNITINGTGENADPYLISSSFNEIDSDTTNELNSNFYVSAGGNLVLTDPGGSLQVPLAWIKDGNDIHNNNSGNVGIGTSNPTEKLHLYGGTLKIDDGANPYKFPPSDGNANQFLKTNGAGNISWASIPTSSGPDNDWTIDGSDIYSGVSGNVGIGTSSPNTKLEVYSNSPELRLVSSQSNSLANSYVRFGDMTGGSFSERGWIGLPGSGNYLELGSPSSIFFNTNFAYRMVITSSGNIGIGTSNPSAKLDLVGTFQYVDGNEAPGKILTTDGNGNSAWASNSHYTEYGNLNSNSTNHNTNWESTNCSFTFNKIYNDSKIEIHLNSRIYSGIFASTNGILFEIRVDGNSPDFDNHGSIKTSQSNEFISIFAVFDSLPLGQHTVDLYAKMVPTGNSVGVVIDPGGFGGKMIVKETF